MPKWKLDVSQQRLLHRSDTVQALRRPRYNAETPRDDKEVTRRRQEGDHEMTRRWQGDNQDMTRRWQGDDQDMARCSIWRSKAVTPTVRRKKTHTVSQNEEGKKTHSQHEEKKTQPKRKKKKHALTKAAETKNIPGIPYILRSISGNKVRYQLWAMTASHNCQLRQMKAYPCAPGKNRSIQSGWRKKNPTSKHELYE